MVVLSLLLLVITMIGFGVMDEIAHHYDSIKIPFMKNNPMFWDKRISWRNKWKYRQSGRNRIKDGEIFWGSSRWFVFLTDGWHLVQFISYQFLSMSISFLISEKAWVALLLSLPIHLLMSTVKALTMKVV